MSNVTRLNSVDNIDNPNTKAIEEMFKKALLAGALAFLTALLSNLTDYTQR